jgi:Fur family transcriptional regulator, ferric uptake regulator
MSASIRPTVEEILGQLRKRGDRITTARRMVVTALIEATRHLTAEDLAGIIQRQHPEVNLSTVYRTLESLEQAGIVEHTHVGHGASVYHVGIPHQHLICEACGAVIDAPVELLEDLRHTLNQRYGFELHTGHAALLGLCNLHHPLHRPAPNTSGDCTAVEGER